MVRLDFFNNNDRYLNYKLILMTYLIHEVKHCSFIMINYLNKMLRIAPSDYVECTSCLAVMDFGYKHVRPFLSPTIYQLTDID